MRKRKSLVGYTSINWWLGFARHTFGEWEIDCTHPIVKRKDNRPMLVKVRITIEEISNAKT